MLPTDQKGYESALKNYLSKEKPAANNLEIVELDIPVATGFSNETIIFKAQWEEEGKEQSEKFVGRIEPKDGGIFREPSNALSNIGFMILGLIMFWVLAKDIKSNTSNQFTGLNSISILYAAAAVFLGPGVS